MPWTRRSADRLRLVFAVPYGPPTAGFTGTDIATVVLGILGFILGLAGTSVAVLQFFKTRRREELEDRPVANLDFEYEDIDEENKYTIDFKFQNKAPGTVFWLDEFEVYSRDDETSSKQSTIEKWLTYVITTRTISSLFAT